MRRIISALVGLTFALSANVANARAKPAGERGRPKVLSGEATQRGDSKSIDFGETQIGGTTKAPAISDVRGDKRANDHDFVKIRTRWSPEMVNSASSINY